MKILVTKDATIAGTDWKKGTVLQVTRADAERAIADNVADAGEALDKAIAAAKTSGGKKGRKPAPQEPEGSETKGEKGPAE